MKKLIFLCLIGLTFFSSCSKYQYVSISSSLPQTTNREFKYETDSLRISYQFTGNNGPIQIEILNKLAQDIFIDWSRSALVIDDYVMPYQLNTSQSTNDRPKVFLYSNYMKPTQSTTLWLNYNNEQISSISPKTKLKMATISLQSAFLPIQPYDKIKTSGTEQGSMLEIHQFNQSNAPLKFSSTIQISTQQDFKNSTEIEHSFWASEVFEHNDGNSGTGNANQFQIRESTGVGTVLIYLSIFGALFAVFLATN